MINKSENSLNFIQNKVIECLLELDLLADLIGDFIEWI